MQGSYQRTYEDVPGEEDTIVVDLIPPQYQMSPAHSPSSANMSRTPERGE